MFATLLIANRGEIACRIIRTARRLGIRTVAVYSAADADALHVAMADEALAIGPAPARESYLDIAKIIAAAKRSSAQAIHPGYGFLAENAAFAEACAAADIAFIGPPPAAIRAMGSKAAAKTLMEAAGVPRVPGYHGEEHGAARLAEAAARIGYPVLIKATAGGGGKGMRVVERAEDFAAALASAQRESKAAFGDDRVLVEKYLTRPHHIEIQVFADRRGETIHLFERDCSIQRRHQKVIEEAPAPGMSEERRRAMGAAAVAAAQAVGYVGAGTVEFIAEGDAFYFMEMNTRLQVEHPVTEMITGQDLVEWQFRVASGEPLQLDQAAVTIRGHAIEVRLYAEDAHGDFLPQAGTVLAWEPPVGAGIRVDHGLAAGAVVSPYYDPMMAKVIAHGATREEARRRLVAALQDLTVLGIETNRRFLIDCLSHPAFARGETSTAFIEQHFPAAARARPAPDTRMRALAAVLIDERARFRGSEMLSHWHSTGTAAAPLLLRMGEERVAMDVACEDERRYRVSWEGGSEAVELVALHGSRVRFRAGGLEETARFVWEGDTLHLSLDGTTAMFEDMLLARRGGAAGAVGGAALAPMTGMVVAVRVKPGDAVKRGQVLVVLEAMKMEHEILAPRDGTVATVQVAPGDQVPTRRLLVELADDAAQ
ncbi:MAG: acetyl/propionyl/methylcrotonyl-CoA carboxylase subunit alpha [Stellaceae bacterium]